MKKAFALILLAAACASPRPAARPVISSGASPEAAAAVPAPAAEPARCAGQASLVVSSRSVAIAVNDATTLQLTDEGTVDVAVIKAMLETMAGDPDAACAKTVVLEVNGAFPYQRLVDVMDAAVQAGRTDVELTGSRAALFPAPPTIPPLEPCTPGPTEVQCLLVRTKPGATTSPPQVIVAPGSITIRTERARGRSEVVIDDVVPLGDDAALRRLHRELQAVRLSDGPDQDTLIVLADADIAAELVAATTAAARGAGYVGVLFAIKTP